ncbi:MAG: hypothetical protein KDD11_06450 [Acidobacteria bacterium]|nr:hypothetical protein [Acidobacteriota bacterium]
MPEAFEVGLRVARVLDALGVDYFVVGSLASSFHGTPRSTHDIDLVADLRPAHGPLLVAELEEDFYIDLDSVRRAIRDRSSFNLLHLATMFKVDMFVLKTGAHAREEMRRRRRVEIGEDIRSAIDIATAEDTVLQKLVWYRLGGEVSDRQWNDLVSVLRVQGDSLDRVYLKRWAAELGLSELLVRAFAE